MRSFSVQLPQYEGPLELLLNIVRRNELPITDLPLAPIAAQYLAYIREAEALDVNLGMEWIEMAARLIQWKSNSLLPADPTLPDPGAAMVQELSHDLKTLSETHLSAAKEFLADQSEEQERRWTHTSEERFREQPPADEEPFASLWTVRRKAQTLRDLFQKRRQTQTAAFDLDLDSTSVEEMRLAALLELEVVERGVWFSAAAWFVSASTLERRICLFLALLDLAGNGVLRIDEDLVNSSVRLCRA
jgi:segregation and condensation protein A